MRRAPRLHGFVELAAHRKQGPTVITGGKGIYVFDEKGTPFIGFGEKALIDAATEQMHKLPFYHTRSYKSVNPAIDLAERLSSMVPIKDSKIYFALSGSEANDFLVKSRTTTTCCVTRQTSSFLAHKVSVAPSPQAEN